MRKVTVTFRGYVPYVTQTKRSAPLFDKTQPMECEVMIEDARGNALVVNEPHRLIFAVTGEPRSDEKLFDGGVMIDLSDKPDFDLKHWIDLVTMAF